MQTEVVYALTEREAHPRQTEDGVEYWPARDVQHLLGYATRESFINVVSKAKIACELSGFVVADHFPDVTNMVDVNARMRREAEDDHHGR